MRARCAIFSFCMIALFARNPAAAQVAAIQIDVTSTLAALVEGDVDTFVDFFHDDVRGFFVDRTAMVEGMSALAFRALLLTGLQTNLVASNLDVNRYGNTAVSTGYLTGTVRLPGGAIRTGTWKYSDTRVLEDGLWKIVQYHISPVTE